MESALTEMTFLVIKSTRLEFEWRSEEMESTRESMSEMMETLMMEMGVQVPDMLSQAMSVMTL